MKVVVIFDKEGNVVAMVPCDEQVKAVRCILSDLPTGAVVDRVNLENRKKPVAEWHDTLTEAEQRRTALVRGLAEQVKNGVSLRELIGSMNNLSNSEKWKLEEEVKANGI